MTIHKNLLKILTPLAFVIGVCLPAHCESPEQVLNRLDEYRQLDAEAARRKQEDYAKRWKCYGVEEIDTLRWRQQKDGTVITIVKPSTGQVPCTKSPEHQQKPWYALATNRFEESLDNLVRAGIVRPYERDRIRGAKESSDSWLGVNCQSLMINRKAPYMNWGSWARPQAGSPDEQLVVDRCAIDAPK